MPGTVARSSLVVLGLALTAAVPRAETTGWQAGGEIGGYVPLAETRAIYAAAPMLGLAVRRRVLGSPLLLGGRLRLEPLVDPAPAARFWYLGGWLDSAWTFRPGVALEASIGWTWRWIDLRPDPDVDGGPAGRLVASFRLPPIWSGEVWLGAGVEAWRASRYETVTQVQASATVWFPRLR